MQITLMNLFCSSMHSLLSSSRGFMIYHSRGFAATASSVWAEVSRLGRQPGMINLGQGFPDFPGSKVTPLALTSTP